MSKPLVTVITPAYNCGKYLDETIRSVLIQDYPNLDYILIDDCSTDDTQAVLAKYGSAIKLIKHTQNKGEQATVNEGLRAVFGKYFLIVNADDPLLPGAINKLVGFMEANPDILCAYPNWDCINEDSSLKLHVTPRDYDFDYLVRHHTWMMSVGSIFKSDVIKLVGYRDESFRWLGDADYWLRIGLVGKMARYPETLACWRYHNGQASSQKNSARAKEHIRVIRKHFGVICSSYYAEAVCWSYIVAASVTNSSFEIMKYLKQSVVSHPRLLVSYEFWDILIKRSIYILRRRV